MFAVVVVQSAIAVAVVGLLSIVRPLRFLGIRSRRGAAAVLAAGVLLGVVGMILPAHETRIAPLRSRLDEFAPAYQFHESHATHVEATPAQTFRAIRAITADEILLFRALTSIRRFGRAGPESILNAPEKQPLLDVATRTSFLLLAEDADREVVVGTLVVAPAGFRPRGRPMPDAFKRLSDPGFAKATMNFRVEPDGAGGSHVTTETRVFATDAASRYRFAAYWRVIYPGSALIRRMWLRAIRQRAEENASARVPRGRS
jgi:hypothetical protein